MVHAFDIFQMLDVLQDLRGAVAQQVSLLFCPSLLHPPCQVLSVCGQVSHYRLFENADVMCNLEIPAVLASPRMGF